MTRSTPRLGTSASILRLGLGLSLTLGAGCSGTKLDRIDLSFPPDEVDMAPTGQPSFIRVHYRLQDGADATKWGVHFWGAGSVTPTWGSPQLFDKKDEFGAYTDVRIDASKGAEWLGLIPLTCPQGNCRKDVETSVRFADLEKNAQDANIGECWITQGQAVQIKKPGAGEVAYKIGRAKDFIDLGNGKVRLMFRVAQFSSGTVSYGAAMGTLDKQVTWSSRDTVNVNGVMLEGLTPGQKVFFKIAATLNKDGKDFKDETAVLDITPGSFTAVSDAAGWASWARKGVMYQLIVRTFADGGAPKAAADPDKDSGIDTAKRDGVGDLVGLRKSLPYLKDLGADAIWMTPVFKAKSYHGYDTTDFYDVDPEAGTKKDFADLTKAAHDLGIRILLDLVQNHVADVNPWFVAATDSKAADHEKYRDWFVWSDEYSNMFADPHPWDPSSVIWACKSYRCYHAIFGAAMPELNFRNPEVRAEMKKIAEFWIKLGADGYRLDASKHIDQFDDNNTIALDKHGTHVWWKEFNAFVKKVARPAGADVVMLAGENRWDDPTVAPRMVPYASDMDSQFDFPFRTLLGNFLTGKSGDDVDFIKYLKNLQAETGVVAKGGNANHFYQRFLSNHDVDRPASQFAPEVLKLAATVVMTVPGMPVVYYGEEFGKRGKRDKYLGTETYEHDEFIREPMSWYQKLSFTGDKKQGWDIDFATSNQQNADLKLEAGVCKAPNPQYPFIKFMAESDPNSWAAQKDQADSLFAHYKKLLTIRRQNPTFTDMDSVVSTVKNTAELYEYTVSKGAVTLTVVLNRKAAAQSVTRPAMVKDLLTDKQGTTFEIPAFGALILQ